MKTILPSQSVFIDLLLPRVETKTQAIIRDIALVAGFALLTAFCAQLRFEIGVVPITAQTFAVLLAGALLGSKRGAFSQITYLLGGLIGLPLFARGGGVSYLLSPTFGYIVGFILASFFIGLLCERGFDRRVETAILAMLGGNLLIYLPGLLWLARFVSIDSLLTVGFYPFLLGDLLKILLAGSILPLGWRLIKRFKNK